MGNKVRGKQRIRKSEFHDLDYSFRDESDEEDIFNSEKARAEVNIGSEATEVGGDAYIDSNYVFRKSYNLVLQQMMKH